MSGQTVKIRSSEGGEFDCYLVAPTAEGPKSDGTMPAIVLASAVHGVDTDIRAIADEFAANGVIAAAPICSGARFRGRCPMTTAAPSSARSRGSTRSRPASAISSTCSPICARCRSSTARPR